MPDDIRGFPTIKLYPAGKKDSPLEYNGDRTVEDLIAFIKKEGTHKVEAVIVEQFQEQGKAAPAATEQFLEEEEEETVGHDEL